MMQNYVTPFLKKHLVFRLAWLVISMCMFAMVGFSQSGSLVVSGSLKHEKTKQRLDNVTVSVLRGGEAFDEIDADRNGKYFLDLPLRNNYVIVFRAEGMVSKRVAINSASVPEDELTEGFMFDLDMSLFDVIEGFDESIMETPIGIAEFDERSGRIQFDLDHTNDMRRLIDDELDRLADLADDLERAQMRYENAMEDGERAEARSRWEDAREEYEKALKFIPGDAAAQSALDRVNGQLDAIFQEEESAAAAEAAAAEAEAEEAARRAEAQAALEESAREAREAEEAAAAAAEAQREAEARASEQAARQRDEENATDADSAVQEDIESEIVEVVVEEEAEDVSSRRRSRRDAAAESRQAQMDADAAAQQAVLDSEREAREARQREWEAEQMAREAAKQERKAQAQARAQNFSKRSGQSEDEAEAYYRQALVSERQAMAAEVQDAKDDVNMNTRRWKAEAGDRSNEARRQALNLNDGRGGRSGREVPSAYPGKEAEHRSTRAANLAEIEATKQSDKAIRVGNASRLKNRGQEELLDIDIMLEASKDYGSEMTLSPEDRDIPQGVQETSYDIQNGLVIMRTVRSGDVVKRYRKVVMKTGTYYFCGDRSITKTRWDLETNFAYD